jgi:BolA family transcriptional regulator, general stress-responsive regulator
VVRNKTGFSMRMGDAIAEKLTKAFTPERLTVIDESHRHEGHVGWRHGGETHFRVAIIAAAFSGKSRLDRHRMVNQALSEELAGGIHALAIEAAAPGEAN